RRATGEDADRLRHWAGKLHDPGVENRPTLAQETELALLMARYPDRSQETVYDRELPMDVDRERARYSAWYELFPRSCAAEPGAHGAFRDCEARLPYIAGMGFDVVYLPPIHPIGTTFRKGRNNAATASP